MGRQGRENRCPPINIFLDACTTSEQPGGTGSMFLPIWFSLLLLCTRQWFGLPEDKDKFVSSSFSQDLRKSRKIAEAEFFRVALWGLFGFLVVGGGFCPFLGVGVVFLILILKFSEL